MDAQAQFQELDANKGVSHEEQASRNHAAEEKATQKSDEDSLTTILTLAQRTSLIVLLAATTATMRENMLATFDAAATTSQGSSLETDVSQDEKIMNPNIDPGTVDVEALEREKKLIAAREKELSAPKIQELKHDMLAWFDQWREAVVARVGEVLKRKKDAKQALEEDHNHGNSASKITADIEQKIDPRRSEDDQTDAASTEVSQMLMKLYPATETPLLQLDKDKRLLIVHSMLLILLSLEHYAAPSRVLLVYLINSLNLPVSVLDADETKTAQGLLQAAKHLSGQAEVDQHAAASEKANKWKIGLATVAGAALVGITGGMAAPLVAAGIGSVMGGLGLGATAAAGYLGSVAGSSILVGGLFGAYGGKMTGKMMDNYTREVSDFAFVPLRHPEVYQKHNDHGKHEDDTGKNSADLHRLRVTIGISGWLTEKEEVVSPWRVLGQQTEVFALRWELESLMNLGNAISAMVTSTAWHYAKKEILARTILADMMAALWPLGLLQLGRLVDNPFSIAKTRADKAGAVLADALINKAQGERPVTLIGYSLGARVIYSCLMTLAARKAFGLVESVVLIGSPLPSDSKDWRAMRSVVSGRLVNVFSKGDYILGFLYRTSSIQLGVAGLQKIDGVHGVENIDVSDTVSGHLKYQYLVGSILHKIGFDDLDLQALQQEREAFRKMEEAEILQLGKLKDKFPDDTPEAGSVNPGGTADAATKRSQGTATDEEVERLKSSVQEKTHQSLGQGEMEEKDAPVRGGGSIKDSTKTTEVSNRGYLGFMRDALPLRTAHSEKPSNQNPESTASITTGQGDQYDGSVHKEKTYLEMVADGGANVGSAASSLFSDAKSRLNWSSNHNRKQESKDK